MKKLNSGTKAVWGISEIGFSITATLETAFFLFFLTDVAMLPLAISGAIAAASGLVDAVTALIAGVILDKFNFKSGKYRPWLMYAPLAAMVFFILSFTKIGGDVTAGVIIAIAYVISHFFWNLAYTANRSMTNVLTDDPNERAFLSGRLGAGAALGRVCASLLVPNLTAALTSMVTGVMAYTITAGLVSILYIICYGIHFAVTKGSEEPADPDAPKAAARSISFADMGRNLISNPNLILIFLHDMMRLIAYYTMAAGTAYYCRVVLGDPTASSTLLMVFYIGCFLGSFVASRVAKVIGTKMTTIVGMGGWIVIWVIAYFLNPGFMLLNVLMFLSQVSFGLAYGLTANLYSMCGTYAYWKTGKNTMGVTMSFLTLSIKLGVALRGIVIPAFLGFIAYDATATTFDAAAQGGISFMYFLLPVIILAISLVPFLFFRIKDDDIPKMNAEIAERESKANAEAAA